MNVTELPIVTKYPVVADFPCKTREIEHLFIPLRDGTRLAARAWIPVGAELDPVPAILEYLPYRKRDGTRERDSLTHPYLAGHGYACVRVDIRGCGESDGLLFDEYATQEQDDALEVIAWLDAQPWCSGAVGMMGISWGGFNALQVAARQPPALRAIITLCSTDDRYRDDVHFMGGAMLTAKFAWAGFFSGAMCRPPDPALVGDRWRDMWLHRLHNLPLFLEPWVRHQQRDSYWRHGSVAEDYHAIQCPVFAVGGWTDGYSNAIPRLLSHLNVPRKGLIGPWAHDYPHLAAPGPRIGFLQIALRWWDHWLKGIDSGMMREPMLQAWMTGSTPPAPRHQTLPGRWIAEPCWPPRSVTRHHLYLTDQGLLEHGRDLTPRPVRTPQTVGRHAGSWCPFGRTADQAGDQRGDDERSVVFDTPPLDATIELLGAVVLTIDLICDQPVATLVARLCDVRPDQASLRVSYGILNLAQRDGDATPAPLMPGRCYRVHLRLNDVAAAFPAGHRIRLALSTTYWPVIWPNPEPATVTVLGGMADLPVRASSHSDSLLPPPPDPVTAKPEPVTALGPGLLRLDRPGLELGGNSSFTCHIDDDDPLSAVVEMRQTQTIARGSWRTRIETSAHMSCSRDAFNLRATMRAWEADAEVASRDWNYRVARRWL